MSGEQSTGEVIAFGIIDQASELAKSARMTQQTLELQIEELIAMEARVNVAVGSIHAAVKNLEAERVKLEAERAQIKAIGPTLQQNAAWAMRETLREQGTEIRSAMKVTVQDALIIPLQDIQAGAGHVRANIKETKWLTLIVFTAMGCAVGLAVGYMPVRSDLNALVEHVNQIDHYLSAQQAPQAVTVPDPPPSKDHKGKGK